MGCIPEIGFNFIIFHSLWGHLDKNGKPEDFLKVNLFSGSHDSFQFSSAEGFLITIGLAVGELKKIPLLYCEQWAGFECSQGICLVQ